MKIVKINVKENCDVYDIEVKDNHNMYANGICVHNCEIGMYPVMEYPDGTKTAGWSCCNLSEIIGSKCKTPEDFYKACKGAAILGTLQAAYTDFPFLTKATEDIMKRDALLGVSITGMMDQSEILFDPEVQKRGAEIVIETNKEIASLIGINPARRTTCVKPSGTASIIAKTGSGIHPLHSRRYLRRVQSVNNEFCFNYFKMFNPHAVENKLVASRDNSTCTVMFPCEVPAGSIVKNQISALDFLDKIKITQNNWIKYGVNHEQTNDFDKNLTHNVSNTVVVKEDEWDEVCDFIYENRYLFCGISLLSSSGDLDYKQAPFTTIHTPLEIVKEYGDGSVMASGVICAALEAFDNDLWDACSAVLYDYEKLKSDLSENTEDCDEDIRKALLTKIKWIEQAKRYADKYMNSDYKRMTYCLKDVHNWKLYCDLKRDWTEVPWDDAIEDEETFIDVDTMASASCVGGKCEI